MIGDIKLKFNFFACKLSKARQINPRPYLAIKFIFFALVSEVEITKSPSFSLFSSSARQNRDDSKDDSDDDGKVVSSPTKAALKAAADKDKEEEKEER